MTVSNEDIEAAAQLIHAELVQGHAIPGPIGDTRRTGQHDLHLDAAKRLVSAGWRPPPVSGEPVEPVEVPVGEPTVHNGADGRFVLRTREAADR